MSNATFKFAQHQGISGYYPILGLREITFTTSGSVKEMVWRMESAPYDARINVKLVTFRGRTLVSGGCFLLHDSAHDQRMCDGDDGTLDGWMVFPAIRPGTYYLWLTNSDSLGLVDVPARFITKQSGQLLSITINAQRQASV